MTFAAICKNQIPKCSVAAQHRSVRCEVPIRYTGLLPTAAPEESLSYEDGTCEDSIFIFSNRAAFNLSVLRRSASRCSSMSAWADVFRLLDSPRGDAPLGLRLISLVMFTSSVAGFE